MSRIGKLPVKVPEGVKVSWNEPVLTVQGPKGDLKVEVKKPCSVKVEEGVLNVTRPDNTRKSRSYQGLYRSLVYNAVHGVTEGFEKRLQVVGVGYRADVEGDQLKLSVGYASPKVYRLPDGVDVNVEKDIIVVRGIDKGAVGNAAARIRAYRPPEPYKGKGIRYQDEQITKKAGKAGAGK
ncbi:MAG: 50S ribosomal protein L6 [bacterium]